MPGSADARWAVHQGEGALAPCCTAVVYGSPLLDSTELSRLRGPVLGIFGEKDAQFPSAMVDDFRRALAEAGVDHQISGGEVYRGQGHAFWRDMEQVMADPQGAQAQAWRELTAWLRKNLVGARGGEQRRRTPRRPGGFS